MQRTAAIPQRGDPQTILQRRPFVTSPPFSSPLLHPDRPRRSFARGRRKRSLYGYGCVGALGANARGGLCGTIRRSSFGRRSGPAFPCLRLADLSAGLRRRPWREGPRKSLRGRPILVGGLAPSASSSMSRVSSSSGASSRGRLATRRHRLDPFAAAAAEDRPRGRRRAAKSDAP